MTNAPEATKADARQRSVRTLLQGLAIDVAVAVGAALLFVLPSIDDSELLTVAAWTAVAVAVLKSVLTAIASYLTRLALPPSDG